MSQALHKTIKINNKLNINIVPKEITNLGHKGAMIRRQTSSVHSHTFPHQKKDRPQNENNKSRNETRNEPKSSERSKTSRRRWRKGRPPRRPFSTAWSKQSLSTPRTESMAAPAALPRRPWPPEVGDLIGGEER